jgi:hypothetical protein
MELLCGDYLGMPRQSGRRLRNDTVGGRCRPDGVGCRICTSNATDSQGFRWLRHWRRRCSWDSCSSATRQCHSSSSPPGSPPGTAGVDRRANQHAVSIHAGLHAPTSISADRVQLQALERRADEQDRGARANRAAVSLGLFNDGATPDHGVAAPQGRMKCLSAAALAGALPSGMSTSICVVQRWLRPPGCSLLSVYHTGPTIRST